MEENAQDLQELRSQVGMKHTAMMTEREMAADVRDQTLKCMLQQQQPLQLLLLQTLILHVSTQVCVH